jgi:hypothetical protein
MSKISFYVCAISSYKMANKSDFGTIDGRCQCPESTVPQPIKYCQKQNCNKIAYIFNTRPLNVSFRRKLVGENLQPWYHFVLRLAHIHLRESNMVVLSFVSLCINRPRNNSSISCGRRWARSYKNDTTGAKPIDVIPTVTFESNASVRKLTQVCMYIVG